MLTGNFLIDVTSYSVLLIASYLFITTSLFFCARHISERYPHRKLTREPFNKLLAKRELITSIPSILIFAGTNVVIFYLTDIGRTSVYWNISQYGWIYFVLSFWMLVLTHDTFFYFTHRAMHHPKIFPYLHSVHHRSKNPTPYSYNAYDIGEALIHATYFPLVIIFIPLHPAIIMIFVAWTLFFGVAGHMSVEIFPKDWIEKKRGNTIVHHHLHHQTVNYNFGMYFSFWDRLLGTLHPQYEAVFDTVVNDRTREVKDLSKIAFELQNKT